MNPRLCELREAGRVIRTDRQRPTHSGRQAFVHVAAAAGDAKPNALPLAGEVRHKGANPVQLDLFEIEG